MYSVEWLALVSDQLQTFSFLNVPLVIAYLLVHSGTPLKVTINCSGGCWHSMFYHFNISKPVTDNQVTVKQHMKEIYYLEAKKLLF